MLKTRSLSDFAPLVLRIVLGIIFIVHGAMKFMHMSRAEHLFSKLSIPLPGIAAPAIALLEVIGGIALILGLGSRFFALLLAIDMLVAIAIAKVHAGFVGGWEFELVLLAGLLALACGGPGAISLARNRHKESLFA
jgi:putative oxidoreductase